MTNAPPSADSTADILAFTLALADEADAIALSYFRGELGTERKDDGTLVTRADRAVEGRIRERIAERFPDHGILGEEQGWSAGTEGAARWIVDPIDGTNSFARGIPVWATLIAFERAGRIEVGVASAPALGTRWWASRGTGAWRAAIAEPKGEPERIHTSRIAELREAQVLYGSHALALERWPRTFEPLLAGAWRTRGYGDFWGHCLVAEGAAEVMLEGEIKPWDIAALKILVEEAGGHLTDGIGRPRIDAGYSVTANRDLHNTVLRLLEG